MKHRSTPAGRFVRPVLLIFALAGCGGEPASPLPALNLDTDRIAVAGFSSGAAMAQQVHLAFSGRVIGAALLSGPPYHCAEGKLDTALARCMKGAPDVDALAKLVRERAGTQLAPIAGLDGDRVLVAHGKGDTLVGADVARASASLYEALGLTVTKELDGDYAHVFPTLSSGGDCDVTAAPYLGACDLDFAGNAMQALFGNDAAAGEGSGALIAFDQSPFAVEGKDPSLGDTGYLYVPTHCAAGEPCGLLIVFHGCEQHAGTLGERFAREAGFNRWADGSDVAVLYPQTTSSYLPLNPKACWDWWGYTGGDYDTRDGAQLAWLANLTAALGAPLR